MQNLRRRPQLLRAPLPNSVRFSPAKKKQRPPKVDDRKTLLDNNCRDLGCSRLFIKLHANLELADGFIGGTQCFFAMAAEIVARFFQVHARVFE